MLTHLEKEPLPKLWMWQCAVPQRQSLRILYEASFSERGIVHQLSRYIKQSCLPVESKHHTLLSSLLFLLIL